MDTEFSNLRSYSKPPRSSQKTKAFLYVTLFIILIGSAIIAGNYFLSDHQEKKNEQLATPTPLPRQEDDSSLDKTPAITTSITPVPSQEMTLTPSVQSKATTTPTKAVVKLRIEVLNGSGVQGEAAKMASFLKGLGYSITSTGNADTFDYTQTVIQIKKSKTEFASQLKKDLSSSYTVHPTIQTLAESEQADAIVIVGAN